MIGCLVASNFALRLSAILGITTNCCQHNHALQATSSEIVSTNQAFEEEKFRPLENTFSSSYVK